MDLAGIAGWILVKGSVKKEDFFYFFMEFVKNEGPSFEQKPPVFFMEKAKIHKSKAYMTRIFNKFYNCLYNALHSPQLNPIDYAFSKIKAQVAKMHPNTEKYLIQCIYNGISGIIPKNFAGYVYQSYKFMKIAYESHDFI